MLRMGEVFRTSYILPRQTLPAPRSMERVGTPSSVVAEPARSFLRGAGTPLSPRAGSGPREQRRRARCVRHLPHNGLSGNALYDPCAPRHLHLRG